MILSTSAPAATTHHKRPVATVHKKESMDGNDYTGASSSKDRGASDSLAEFASATTSLGLRNATLNSTSAALVGGAGYSDDDDDEMDAEERHRWLVGSDRDRGCPGMDYGAPMMPTYPAFDIRKTTSAGRANGKAEGVEGHEEEVAICPVHYGGARVRGAEDVVARIRLSGIGDKSLPRRNEVEKKVKAMVLEMKSKLKNQNGHVQDGKHDTTGHVDSEHYGLRFPVPDTGATIVMATKDMNRVDWTTESSGKNGGGASSWNSTQDIISSSSLPAGTVNGHLAFRSTDSESSAETPASFQSFLAHSLSSNISNGAFKTTTGPVPITCPRAKALARSTSYGADTSSSVSTGTSNASQGVGGSTNERNAGAFTRGESTDGAASIGGVTRSTATSSLVMPLSLGDRSVSSLSMILSSGVSTGLDNENGTGRHSLTDSYVDRLLNRGAPFSGGMARPRGQVARLLTPERVVVEDSFGASQFIMPDPLMTVSQKTRGSADRYQGASASVPSMELDCLIPQSRSMLHDSSASNFYQPQQQSQVFSRGLRAGTTESTASSLGALTGQDSVPSNTSSLQFYPAEMEEPVKARTRTIGSLEGADVMQSLAATVRPIPIPVPPTGGQERGIDNCGDNDNKPALINVGVGRTASPALERVQGVAGKTATKGYRDEDELNIAGAPQLIDLESENGADSDGAASQEQQSSARSRFAAHLEQPQAPTPAVEPAAAPAVARAATPSPPPTFRPVRSLLIPPPSSLPRPAGGTFSHAPPGNGGHSQFAPFHQFSSLGNTRTNQDGSVQIARNFRFNPPASQHNSYRVQEDHPFHRAAFLQVPLAPGSSTSVPRGSEGGHQSRGGWKNSAFMRGVNSMFGGGGLSAAVTAPETVGESVDRGTRRHRQRESMGRSGDDDDGYNSDDSSPMPLPNYMNEEAAVVAPTPMATNSGVNGPLVRQRQPEPVPEMSLQPQSQQQEQQDSGDGDAWWIKVSKWFKSVTTCG